MPLPGEEPVAAPPAQASTTPPKNPNRPAKPPPAPPAACSKPNAAPSNAVTDSAGHTPARCKASMLLVLNHADFIGHFTAHFTGHARHGLRGVGTLLRTRMSDKDVRAPGVGY